MKDYTKQISDAVGKLGASEVKFEESSVGEKNGWAFAVYYGRPYAGFVSSLVKTNIGAVRNFLKYANTGSFSLYGNAE